MTVELSAPLVLASASARRKELLEHVGIPFSVEVSTVDERAIVAPSPEAFVRAAATLKAEDVLGRVSSEAYVLGADTVVVVQGEVLGKPADDSEAEGMLRALLGRTHEVFTGVCVGRAGLVHDSIAVCSEVTFREANDEDIARYVATGEGRDKAGAYAIQGLASGFVERIDGSYTNIVGLPVAETLQLLRAAGVLLTWP